MPRVPEESAKYMKNLVIAHDYLIQMGGAERVVAAMLRGYPGAPVYTSAVKRSTLLPEFRTADIRVSWMQQLPGIERHFKKYFALYPLAFRSFGPVDAPVAWVSASTFAKCLRFTRRTATVLYCHNPTRFLWQPDSYVNREVRNSAFSSAVRLISPVLKKVDRAAARKFDRVVVNSRNVQAQVRRAYGINADVVNPGVSLDRFQPSERDEGYYLIVSRLVAYKEIDRAVLACTRLKRRLIVAGDGPDRARLEGLAGPTVEFLGAVSEERVQELMESCSAFVFPGNEDFGIAPVEAQACGKPVIAFGGGGALETVVENVTGCFFDNREITLEQAMQRCETMKWNPAVIRENAERFSEVRFHQRMKELTVRTRMEKAEVRAIPGMVVAGRTLKS